MKINKDLVISKTILFLFIITFIIIFKSIFGEENTLIGVTTITAVLMLLDRDLTLSPIKNTFRLLGINLLIGIGAHLASENMYLGILLNFAILFFISYIFCSNLRSSIYLPFSLQYLFILSTPVSYDKLPIRLLSLAVGAVVIILSQLIVNKNKLHKSGNKLLHNVCDLITDKIHNKENINDLEVNQMIHDSIDKFRIMVYDKREYNYYLTSEGRLKLNLSISLESIGTLLDRKNINLIDKNILSTLEELIIDVKLTLDNKSCPSSKYVDDLLKICEEKNINDLLNLQVLDSMLLLSDTLDNLRKLDVKHFNVVNISNEYTDIFRNSCIKSFLFDRKSIKFCYGMRVGITIAIGAFIVDHFNLTEGRWILFTILALTTPIYETSHSKTKDRLFATLIGSICIIFLFSIFKDPTSRTIIIILAGYLNGYINKYKYSTIFVTISAIGSAAIAGNIHTLSFNRVFYVFIGAIMAILSNRYIFPYRLNDSIKQLDSLYHSTMIKMLKEVENLLHGNKRPTIMKNLVVLTSLIDSKARTDEALVNESNFSEMITERRNLVANIYELYALILKKDVTQDKQKEIISDLRELIDYSDEDISIQISHLEKDIESTKDIDTKIIISSIAVILQELNHLSRLKKLA